MWKTGCNNVVGQDTVIVVNNIVRHIVNTWLRANSSLTILLTTRNNVAPTALLHPVSTTYDSLLCILKISLDKLQRAKCDSKDEKNERSISYLAQACSQISPPPGQHNAGQTFEPLRSVRVGNWQWNTPWHPQFFVETLLLFFVEFSCTLVWYWSLLQRPNHHNWSNFLLLPCFIKKLGNFKQ